MSRPDVVSRVRRRACRAWVTGLVGLALTFAMAVGAQSVEPTVPTAKGFVSDYVGVVDAATQTRIEAVIEELKARTGAEIAVVVVRTTQPLSAFDYAMKIAEDWKPGAAGKDNGIVFLVATEDRELFILTGYGVEGALPDGRVGAIRDQLVVPAFRSGDYAGGIAAGTAAMARIIAADAGVELTGVPPAPTPRPARQVSPLAMLVLFGLLLLFVVVVARNPLLAAALMSGRSRGHRHWERGGFGGGLGGGGLGGGFGGFGGGGFGGGGAGGRW